MRAYFLDDFDAEWGRILIYSTEWQVEIGKKEAAVSIKDNSNILYRLILNTYLYSHKYKHIYTVPQMQTYFTLILFYKILSLHESIL